MVEVQYTSRGCFWSLRCAPAASCLRWGAKCASEQSCGRRSPLVACEAVFFENFVGAFCARQVGLGLRATPLMIFQNSSKQSQHQNNTLSQDFL
ncbi:unnamed protein product [Phaeothamnion confervicola]